jgi:hypothetical protein
MPGTGSAACSYLRRAGAFRVSAARLLRSWQNLAHAVREKDRPRRTDPSSIAFDPPSNGEYCPTGPTEVGRRRGELWKRIVEEKHRRLGISRRAFAESACGAAAWLFVIDQIACDGGGGGTSPGVDASGYDALGSPLDVVRAAKLAPDLKFLVYHAGWQGTDENHPYDPNAPAAGLRGVDRFVRAIEENQLPPNSNVYAEPPGGRVLGQAGGR